VRYPWNGIIYRQLLLEHVFTDILIQHVAKSVRLFHQVACICTGTAGCCELEIGLMEESPPHLFIFLLSCRVLYVIMSIGYRIVPERLHFIGSRENFVQGKAYDGLKIAKPI